jgi:hypothetical protein
LFTATTSPQPRSQSFGGDSEILGVEAKCGVHHEDADLRPIDRAPRAERRIELDVILHFSSLS